MICNSDYESPRLIDEREAAKVLAVCPRTLWSIRKSGRIPYLKIGRSVRYDSNDFSVWIEANKTIPEPSSN